jgi:hypothetical protein
VPRRNPIATGELKQHACALAVGNPPTLRRATSLSSNERQNPDDWQPGLRFAIKTLNVKSVRRAMTSSDVLFVCLCHNLRRKNEGHRHRSFIDPTRTSKNEVLRGSADPSINAELASNSLDALGVVVKRKDTIMGIELLFQPPKGRDIREFWEACLRWIDARYQYVLSAVIHRDQKRPHMHVLVLPVVNGKLVGADMTSKLNRSQAQRYSFMAHMRETLDLRPDRQPKPKTMTDIFTSSGKGPKTHAAAVKRDAAFVRAKGACIGKAQAHDLIAQPILCPPAHLCSNPISPTSILRTVSHATYPSDAAIFAGQPQHTPPRPATPASGGAEHPEMAAKQLRPPSPPPIVRAQQAWNDLLVLDAAAGRPRWQHLTPLPPPRRKSHWPHRLEALPVRPRPHRALPSRSSTRPARSAQLSSLGRTLIKNRAERRQDMATITATARDKVMKHLDSYKTHERGQGRRRSQSAGRLAWWPAKVFPASGRARGSRFGRQGMTAEAGKVSSAQGVEGETFQVAHVISARSPARFAAREAETFQIHEAAGVKRFRSPMPPGVKRFRCERVSVARITPLLRETFRPSLMPALCVALMRRQGRWLQVTRG